MRKTKEELAQICIDKAIDMRAAAHSVSTHHPLWLRGQEIADQLDTLAQDILENG